MKLKVKGLVFVGFAAAVFAQSALAVDADKKVVTSKQYVDTKFQTKANMVTDNLETDAETWNDSSVYPSMMVLGQVARTATGDDYINADIQSGELIIGLNDTKFAASSDDITASGVTASYLVTSAGVADYAQNKSKMLTYNTADSAETISSATLATQNNTSNETYPTTKNVYEFVTGAISGAGGTYQQTVSSGNGYDSSKLYVGHNGSWNALETTVSSSTHGSTDYVTIAENGGVYEVNIPTAQIATGNSDVTGTLGTTAAAKLVTAGAVNSVILAAGSAAGAETITTNTTNDTTVPTAKNVYDFVSGGYQPKAAAGVKVGNNGSWDSLTVQTDYLALDTSTAGTVQIKVNAADSGTDISGLQSSLSSGANDLTTAWAVKDYVATQLGGLAIPEPTGECASSSLSSDADGGCALVWAYYAAEGTTPAGVRLKWTKMAQVTE